MNCLAASNWLVDTFYRAFPADSVTAVVLLLALIIAAGIALGTVRVLGVSLGIAGVLFAGLAFGQIGFHANKDLLDFIRDFGQILYVFAVGLQVGPGFFSSLRRHGLTLNALAAANVLFAFALVLLIWKCAGLAVPVAAGLFSGATTNTPSLAAAQQALKEVPGYTDAMGNLPSLAYAIAYPGGVIGVIFAMLLVRVIFRIDPQKENTILRRLQAGASSQLGTLNIEVVNTNLHGLALREIPTLEDSGIVVSRIMHDSHVRVAQPEDAVQVGDVLLAVGPREKLEDLLLVVGRLSEMDLRNLPSDITARRVIVTHKNAVGRSVDEFQFTQRYGVVVTRVLRAEVELTPTPQLKLQFGDRVTAVGEKDAVDSAARELGDSIKALDHPQIISVFVGILLGVLVGAIPIAVPGVPAAVKLGLAGGPLLVALVLSRINRIGPLIWYLPISANYALRELGIALFLSCVGLKAGGHFLETLRSGDGLLWMGLGIVITLVPLLSLALFARLVMRMNYLSLCGLMAGSMTDSPALAFAMTIAGPEGPSVSYATVYPLALILRVVCAQLMILLLMR